ncbi:MAG: ABC transporter permease, partial [Clostridiaceae bacterium]|nr:ABC transporter permease [Clostridiaceae bacterium]
MPDKPFHKNPLSMQFDPSDFLPASEEEKKELIVMRESVTFWKDAGRRLRKNKVAMGSLIVIILTIVFAFILPSFYPYAYE